MSDLVVVGDSAVHELLIGLSKDEILDFQRDLAQSLMHVSVQNEGQYQPVAGVVNRPDGQKVLFRSFTSPELVGTKIIVDAAPAFDADGGKVQSPLRGMLSLVDASGAPKGLVNAAGVTAFRTSLCALIPYMWRRDTESILVFGAGKQALWHIRLALALRGSEIKSIVAVNRSGSTASAMIDTLKAENGRYWKSSAELTFLDSSRPGSKERLAQLTAGADVIFCTVPSTAQLFSLDDVLGGGERRRNPLISAIGAWQPQMIELDPEILRYAARKEGAVLVDNRHEVRESTGEGIGAALEDGQLIEVGQVLDWKSDRPTSPRGALSPAQVDAWTSHGFAVYKSVGVSVTDLVSGSKILDLAKEKNVGTLVSNF
ncbi:Ornithine cyclodeaminase/mu-crystallin family [Geosmithia morbida]|uniref:Ornithine cyclodeaminase/mu-crystallin family n=1 Tax=Geosmithia morbida TaxID=1094350 RepID=A0A9P4Z1M3_9HYPO|nr:Ornithine cyclodeaminase/mu-crystallin family [Geosmithia morbida]KAF4124979.1 Ornithine cyclodeaminase/mu-crystallin family [Geosmithia morbida]